MPADANPSGDIFGGWLMAQMDLAAGNAAAVPKGRATVHGEGRQRAAETLRISGAAEDQGHRRQLTAP